MKLNKQEFIEKVKTDATYKKLGEKNEKQYTTYYYFHLCFS